MKLLYFAWIRTNLGVSEEFVDVPSEINDVRGLLDWLINRGESYKAAFSDPVSYTHLTLPTSG